MNLTPSAVDGVELIGPGTAEFRAALAAGGSAVPGERLEPAFPWSVVVANRGAEAVALFGVRFDMLDGKARPCSVVHYADTLRNPEKAGLPPQSFRFVCAEAAYTSLALDGREPASSRTRLNLANLKRMRQVRATLDCVAFADGRFAGPDSLGAFSRFAAERAAELSFMEKVLALTEQPAAALELIMSAASDGDRIEKPQARRLLEGFATGGLEEMVRRARQHRARIELRR